VNKGVGSWFLRKAAGPDCQLIMIDLGEPTLRDLQPNSLYFTGNNFQDFNDIEWGDILDKNRTLVFFDDHQAEIQRLIDAQKRGFRFLAWDDNYIPGIGDNLSLKKVCTPDVYSLLKKPFRYQSNFARTDRLMSFNEYLEFHEKFTSAVKVYAEFPPVWPLDPWRFDIKNKIIQEITQPAVLTIKEAYSLFKQMGMHNIMDLEKESKKYTHFAFTEVY